MTLTSDTVLYAKWNTIIGTEGTGGGTIFYVDEDDYYSWTYLEVAPDNWYQGDELPAETYLNPNFSGAASFDFSNNNGNFAIGQGAYYFETDWSNCNSDNIYAYNDPSSITTIALITDCAEISEISDHTQYDTSSRVRKVNEGEIVIWKNSFGKIAYTKVVNVLSQSYGDDRYELEFEYVITSDGYQQADYVEDHIDPSVGWGGSDTFIGADRIYIGSGMFNTQEICAYLEGDETSRAAQLCSDLVLNGKDDWFLPSIASLELIYHTLDNGESVHMDEAGGFYMSSSEYNANYVYNYSFAGGFINFQRKDSIQSAIRPIRAY